MKVDGKETSQFDIHNKHIFIKNQASCSVCIEYVEHYSECTNETSCVEFDHTFWRLPVLKTLVDIAVDLSDDRLQLWSQQYEQMKREYAQII